MKNKPKNIFPGKVKFYAEGADIEGFVTFCTKNGIEIANPIKKGYVLYGTVSAENYNKLRKPAIMFGIKIKIHKKQGLTFLLKRNRNQTGFLAGVGFVILFTIIMNFFIWEINVVGNEKIKKEEIMKSVETAGLKVGTLSKKHFTQDIEWFVLRENEGLASVEINIQGSKATIIVNERNEEEKFKSDDDVPINIVASKYGIIRSIDVFDGQKTVNPGDAVNKGDLLVSAVYEDRHNKLTLKHARAKVIAETYFETEIIFKLKQTTEEKGKYIGKISELTFLGYNIKLGKKPDKTRVYSEEKSNDFYFFNIKLPINIKNIKFYDVKQNHITYDLKEGKANAYSVLEKFESENMSDMDIISRRTNETATDDEYIINAEYIVLMDIAKEEPILSDIPWKNSDDMS